MLLGIALVVGTGGLIGGVAGIQALPSATVVERT